MTAIPVKRRKPPAAPPALTRKTALPGSAQAGDAGLPVKSQDAQASLRLAQMVNLYISGMSLEEIGAAIGATADEVDRLLQTDAQRYVRSQPQLRVFVRNWVSERYARLLEAVWDEATDQKHPKKLENQDRALRILDSMRKLHGADAPVQAEVKVDAAPEAVEQLVQALSKQQGLGYDAGIFDTDIVDVELVHEAVDQSGAALLDAGERVGEGEDTAL